MKLTILSRPLIWSSLQRPRSPGVILPSDATLVASEITSPAPPTALLPRCVMCQSPAKPFVEEYWHIGDITILFRRVILLIFNGEKSMDMISFFLEILFAKRESIIE
jgi:hypothetical protein